MKDEFTKIEEETQTRERVDEISALIIYKGSSAPHQSREELQDLIKKNEQAAWVDDRFDFKLD